MPGRSTTAVQRTREALGGAHLVPAHHAGLWEPVAETLRVAILRGELAPGTRLVEWELAARLGVSRGPVRDALTRLEQEHLVVTYPRRGAFVLGVTAEDVRELFGLRILLESHAAQEASRRATAESLAELARLWRQLTARAAGGDLAGLIEADITFHRTIVRLAGLRRLLHHWDLLIAPVSALLVLSAELHPDLAHGVEASHGAILKALQAGDSAAAQQAIADHLNTTAMRLVNAAEGGAGRTSAPDRSRRPRRSGRSRGRSTTSFRRGDLPADWKG
jgi:DNA-binding GntR family transcriptional regulator